MLAVSEVADDAVRISGSADDLAELGRHPRVTNGLAILSGWVRLLALLSVLAIVVRGRHR